ncbi:DUF1788 domain-containing protein [bacterium]|nr:DUF1788 domain-containing protein [bacterium]
MSNLSAVFEELKRDLTNPNGPSITTMRNYSFAILVYRPEQEFEMRKKVRQLSDHLRGEQWAVLEISLHRLLLQRLRSLEEGVLQSWIETEKRQSRKNPEKALLRVKEQLANLLEGEEGLARDVVQLVNEFCEKYPEAVDRTVIWIKRLGALYPYYRCSSLLKHLDGKTGNVPVILLYPGERKDKTALSFMGEMPADRDYRPRIYSAEMFH